MFLLLRNSTTENFNEMSSHKCSDNKFGFFGKPCSGMMMAGKCDQTGDQCMKTCGTCKGQLISKCSFAVMPLAGGQGGL